MSSHSSAFSPAEFVPVSTCDIHIGAMVARPIYDQEGVLLVGGGQKLSLTIYQHLCQRGVDRLLVHRNDLCAVLAGRPEGQLVTIESTSIPSVRTAESNQLTNQLDAEPVDEHLMSDAITGSSFVNRCNKIADAPYDEGLRNALVEQREGAVAKLNESLAKVQRGGGLDLDLVSSITEQTIESLVQDVDLFASLGLNPMGSEYPARHSLHSCMVSLNIGLNLGLDEQQLRELALGTQIHDAGMLIINRDVWRRTDKLPRLERLEITKHPVKVFDLIRSLEQIPRRSAFIAYQIHERVDGSGYPRQRVGSQIHFLSKVAAVADVYSALVASRPFRPGILPAKAIEYVVEEGSAGRLDANAVRALIQTTSLYPLGSYVLLNDGRVARTIRSNGVAFERPVVEAWVRGKLHQPPEIIDLSKESAAFVVQAIPSLTVTDDELQGATVPANAAAASLSMLLNLASRSIVADVEHRRAPRVEFVKEVKIVYASADGQEWKARKVQGRNISRTGMAIIDDGSSLPDEVVVFLDQPGGVPMLLAGKIVRRIPVRDEWHEYGIEFIRRVPELPRFPAQETN